MADGYGSAEAPAQRIHRVEPPHADADSHSSNETLHEPAQNDSAPPREKGDPEKRGASTERSGSDSDDGDDGPTPKFSAGFLDPRLKQMRGTYLKELVMGLLLACTAIFAFLSIYWGALAFTPDEVPGLTGAIVDLDGGAIGTAVSQAYSQASGGKSHMTWQPIAYADSLAAQEAVRENKVWVAVVINAGATQALETAIATVDGTYNGSLAVSVFTNEARNQYAYKYELTAIQTPMQMLTTQFASQRAAQLATAGNLPTLLAGAPSTVTQPLGYAIYNIVPFDVPVGNAVVYVGLIYVTIFSFVLTMQNYNARQPMAPYMNLSSLLWTRLCSTIVAYFFLGLAYALLNYAFQIPFDRKFGSGGFVLFWMLCWVSMMALGFPLEAMITILTPKFISFFLILWILSNVSVAFYPIDLLPNFYRYGWAMPYTHFSEACRTIIFSTKNKVGLNFGALLGWVVVGIAGVILFTSLERRQMRRKAGRSTPV